MNTREQGDWGELSAMVWLASVGAGVAYPIGHSRDWDLIAELGERLVRVQVKTSRCRRNGRWEVTIATRGGNQSWNGLSKVLDSSRCDYLLVVVADGRRWFIPSQALGGGSGIVLGGPKYAEYEVDRGSPLPSEQAERPRLQSQIPTRGDVRVVKGARL